MADNKGFLVPKSDAAVQMKSPVSERQAQISHTGSGQWMIDSARGTLSSVLYFLGRLISGLIVQGWARKPGDRLERRGSGCGRGQGRGRRARNKVFRNKY